MCQTKEVEVMFNLRLTLLLVLLIATASLAWWGVTRMIAAPNTVPSDFHRYSDPDALYELIQDKPEGVLIVDVRPESDYLKDHLPTAINIPSGRIEKLAVKPPADYIYLLYCGGGGMAHFAGKHMLSQGYRYVMNIHAQRFVIQNWPYELKAEPNVFAELPVN